MEKRTEQERDRGGEQPEERRGRKRTMNEGARERGEAHGGRAACQQPGPGLPQTACPAPGPLPHQEGPGPGLLPRWHGEGVARHVWMACRPHITVTISWALRRPASVLTVILSYNDPNLLRQDSTGPVQSEDSASCSVVTSYEPHTHPGRWQAGLWSLPPRTITQLMGNVTVRRGGSRASSGQDVREPGLHPWACLKSALSLCFPNCKCHNATAHFLRIRMRIQRDGR